MVPLFENVSPVPYITRAPNDKKPSDKIAVPIYPTLKSKSDSFTVGICFPSFRLAIDQKECQTEISIAEGIQPANAINKAISENSQLNDFVKSGLGLNPFVKAETTAIIVDTARSIIMNLINLSKTEYLPTDTIIEATVNIMIVQVTVEKVSGNTLEKSPAVTTVIAACNVNIVARVSIR